MVAYFIRNTVQSCVISKAKIEGKNREPWAESGLEGLARPARDSSVVAPCREVVSPAKMAADIIQGAL